MFASDVTTHGVQFVAQRTVAVAAACWVAAVAAVEVFAGVSAEAGDALALENVTWAILWESTGRGAIVTLVAAHSRAAVSRPVVAPEAVIQACRHVTAVTRAVHAHTDAAARVLTLCAVRAAVSAAALVT